MSIIETDGERLLLAVRALLAEKGLVTPEEITERARLTSQASPAQAPAWWPAPGSIPTIAS